MSSNPTLQIHLRSRPPLQRMLYIHQKLREGAFPNCSSLSRELELGCAKTVQRDISFMRDRLNLPVEYDSKRHGFYYAGPVEEFPAVGVTESELFALLIAQKALQHYQGTPFHKPLCSAFEKLGAVLDPQALVRLEGFGEALDIRVTGPEQLDAEVFQVVSRAVQQRQVLRFEYRKHAHERWLRRTLEPYQLVCANHRWYVVGRDRARQGMRMFVLHRLRRPEMVNDHFPRPADFSISQYLKGSLGIFRGTGDYEVVVDLDRWAADLCRGRRWHATQELVDLAGGGLRVVFRLDSLEEVSSWVLGWGEHARVVRPRALVERLRRTAAKMSELYSAEVAGAGPASDPFPGWSAG